MNHYNISPHLSLTYLGPSLEQGPLPALFYFSLSAEDSLLLSPFNQPVVFLTPWTQNSLRIFSMTIPGHEYPLPKEQAIEVWVDRIQQGIDPITPFIQDIGHVIDTLLAQNVLIKERIVCAGLSRGGYIATLAAAHHPACSYVLGFAPLTQLKYAKEFARIIHHPMVETLSLNHVQSQLTQKKVRYYIGNRDTRVGTQHAFQWITSLAELAYEARAKNGSFELMIHDSIGLMGHGTPECIFEEGAAWVKRILTLP
jgi:pimeloyl-ACP methyl ester carboxylesterase